MSDLGVAGDTGLIADEPLMAQVRSTRLGETVAAVGILALGAWFLWQALELREGPGYAAIGPRVFPIIVGTGFLLSGLALLVGSLRAGTAGADQRLAEPTDWPRLVGIAVLLAAFIALFVPLGFLITSAAFLVIGSWMLGSRSPVRDVVAGIALSIVTYVVFTRLLGLELPTGPLEEPIRSLRSSILPRVLG